jgi:hypothetical protein
VYRQKLLQISRHTKPRQSMTSDEGHNQTRSLIKEGVWRRDSYSFLRMNIIHSHKHRKDLDSKTEWLTDSRS